MSREYDECPGIWFRMSQTLGGRVLCPVCGAEVKVRKDGLPYMHWRGTKEVEG